MSKVEREIREQPEVLERLLREGRGRAQEIAGRIRERAPRYVVIAARGSSDNAARYAQYLFGAHNRLPVCLATPSLYTVYGAGPSLVGALVVGVSQSGRSPDIVAVLEAGRRDGALTVAITNEPDSPLAQAAEHVLPLGAGPERAVAATKTYTASLGALAMLSAALEASEARRDELTRLPNALAAALEANGALDDAVARYRYAEQFVVVGRGFNYSTAFEVALKMKETSYLIAEPYSPADLLHGPVAMIDRGFPALVIAPSGRVLSDLAALMERSPSGTPSSSRSPTRRASSPAPASGCDSRAASPSGSHRSWPCCRVSSSPWRSHARAASTPTAPAGSARSPRRSDGARSSSEREFIGHKVPLGCQMMQNIVVRQSIGITPLDRR